MSLVLAHQPSGLGGITHASCLVFPSVKARKH